VTGILNSLAQSNPSAVTETIQDPPTFVLNPISIWSTLSTTIEIRQSLVPAHLLLNAVNTLNIPFTAARMDQFESLQTYPTFQDENQNDLFADHNFGFDPSSFAFPDDLFDITEPGFSIPGFNCDYNPDPLPWLDVCNAISVQEVNSSCTSSSSAGHSTENSLESTSARPSTQSAGIS
jgi:hypothetical protein